VLLKPRFEPHTLLLWGLPPAVLLVGIIAIFVAARRRPVGAEHAALSADEQRKLATLVEPGAD
jgi:cytochrome c-type biogenesis protein CcmH